MKTATKELIGFPSCLLIAVFGAYALIKFIASLPPIHSEEDVLVGTLILLAVGVPLLFGIILSIVVLCLWMATPEDKP